MKQAAVGAASATQAVKADKKPFFSQRTLSHFIDFLFVLPALILLGVFTYYPIVKLVQISFTDWNLLNDTWKYVGLKNRHSKIFSQTYFKVSLSMIQSVKKI